MCLCVCVCQSLSGWTATDVDEPRVGTSGCPQSVLAPAVMKREHYNLKKKHDLSSSEEEWTAQEEAEEDGGPPTDSGYSTGSLSSSRPPPPPKKSRKRPPRKKKTPQKRAKPKEEVGWVKPGVVPVPPPTPAAPPPPPLPIIPQKYPPRTAPPARTPRPPPRRIKPVKVEPQSQADQWPPNHRHNRKTSGSQTSLLETLCQAYAAYAAAGRHKTQQKKPTGWRAAVRQAYEKVKKNARSSGWREDAPAPSQAQEEPHHNNPSPQEE